MKTVLFVIVLALSQACQASAAPQAQTSASLEGFVVKLGTSQPVTRARVTLSEIEGDTEAALTATTDGGGRFVFRNVPPGRYRLSAAREGYLRTEYGQQRANRPGQPITIEAGQQLKDAVLGLIPTGTITGRVIDSYGEPVYNASVQALKYSYQGARRVLTPMQTAKTNDLGEYRLFWMQPGQYVVSAIPPAPAAGGNPAESSGTYLPVYFPGTTDAAGAAPVNLQPGVNFTGVDLTLVETRAIHIRGQVFDGVTGQPARGASVSLVPRRAIADGATGPRNSANTPGFFEFRNVAPGYYDLFATANTSGVAIKGSVPIEVGNADIENVTLVLSPGFSLSGRLVIDGRSGLNDAAITQAGVQLQALAPQFSTSLSRIGANGMFELRGITPGDYRLQVSGLPRNFYVKMARLGSADVLAGALHIDGAPRGQFDIVIGPGSGAVDATVVDEKQQPAPGAMVVAVPDTSHRQNFDLYRIAVTDESGHVHLDGIAPGEYKIFAWDEVESGAWQSPDFLRTYEDRGTPVRLDEGASLNALIKVIPQGQ